MAIDQARGGRFVTQKDLTTDYTLSITNVDDGALQLGNNLKYINLVDDIGGVPLRKVDHWDSLPLDATIDTAIRYGYLGRTVIYTGDNFTSNGILYEKGRAYKCVPDTGYIWSGIAANVSLSILRCVASAAQSTASINADDYFTILTADGNTRSIIFCTTASSTSSDLVIKMVNGYDTLDQAKEAESSVILYTLDSDGNWIRTSELNEYISIYNKCTVGYITTTLGAVCGLNKLFFISSSGVTTLHWELISDDEPQAVSPYETVYPINNVCYLGTNPSCFYFGIIPSSTDTLSITLDLSSLSMGQYYNNNIIYLETTKAITVAISAIKSSLSKTVNVTGDDVDGAGKYRISIECLPDESVIATILKINATSSTSASAASAYGIRYDTSTGSIAKIEMIRSIDSTGTVIEIINEVTSSFAQMPCHNFKRCIIKDFTDVPVYYLNDNDSRYKADGATPADLTGVDGDVAVEIPKTYYRVTKVLGTSTSGKEKLLTSGKIDYLVSNAPIPDPPSGTVDAIIYNGVHPAFRVGGEIIDGYETKYDSSTGTLVNTEVPLHSAKDAIYIGAFASVRCHHGNDGIIGKTLRASATDYAISDTNYITPSGTFFDQVNYPKLQSGVAAGVQVTGSTYAGYAVKTMTAINSEARSIAPYRDGDLLYVSLPGVLVNIKPTTSSLPTDMPGGVENAIFYCNTEGTFVYALTSDTVFVSGKSYYTRSGSGTSADPYVYTKATVVIGQSVTGNTYYERSIQPSTSYEYFYEKSVTNSDNSVTTTTYSLRYSTNKWVISTVDLTSNTPTYGTPFAESNTVESFTTFNTLTWSVTGSTTEAPITCSTIDSVYKLTCGPINYGTHNPNFAWNLTNNQLYWDSAITGNPNWALNYRPLVGQKRAFYQLIHGNGYLTDPTSPFYAHTQLEVESLDSDGVSTISLPGGTLSTFHFDNSLTASNAITSNGSNVWIGEDSQGAEALRYKITFNAEYGGWSYTDGTNTLVVNSAYANKPDYFAATTDTTAVSGKVYFTRSGVGPDYTYAKATAIEGTSVTAYEYSTDTHVKSGKTYYTRSGSGTTSDPYVYTAVTLTVGELILTRTLDTEFKANKPYFIQTTGTDTYTQVKVIVGQPIPTTVNYMEQSTYFELYSLYEPTIPLVTDCEFIDSNYNYLELYNTGYRSSFSFSSGLSGGITPGSIGVKLGTWYSTSVTTNCLTKEYTCLSSDSTVTKAYFDDSAFRWTITYTNVSGETSTMYQSDRLDPASFNWMVQSSGPVSVYDKAFFYRNIFCKMAVSALSYAVNIGLIPHFTTGSNTLTFDCVDSSALPYARVWQNTTNNLVIKYLPKSTDQNIMSDDGTRYELTLDDKFKPDTVYYTKNGDTYTRATVTVGATVPANTYYENIYAYHFTSDTTFKSGKDYYQINKSEGGSARYTTRAVTAGDPIPANTFYTRDANDAYGGCWVLAEMNGSVIRRVLMTDMDIVAARITSSSGANTNNQVLFQPVNIESKDAQRTHNSTSGSTTNSTLVYNIVSSIDNVSGLYLQIICVDENGNIPSYFSDTTFVNTTDGTAIDGKTYYAYSGGSYIEVEDIEPGVTDVSQYYTNLAKDIKNIVGSYAGRWVMLKYKSNAYTELIIDNDQTVSKPFSWSESITAGGPWTPYINFNPVYGSTDANNDRCLRFKCKPMIAVRAKSSGRGFTANARIKQFLALMMVIDFGTFDLGNVTALNGGKLDLRSDSTVSGRNTLYGSVTFSGRTVVLGNNTGSVTYDEDIDINILSTDFGSDTKHVVACSWRGIENPFGNIGEYDEGIIPFDRYVDGSNRKGYYECVDPGAYSDNLFFTDASKYLFNYTSSSAFVPTWYNFIPSAKYTWEDNDILNSTTLSGYFECIDPVTMLPVKLVSSYDSSKIKAYWSNYIRGMWYCNTYVSNCTYTVFRTRDYSYRNSILNTWFYHDSPQAMIGARWQY